MLILLNLIEQYDLQRLEEFSKQSLPGSFRYFTNRNFTEAISTHMYTVLYCKNNTDVGYGHIDYDTKSQKYYLGVCVLEEAQRQGIGRAIVEFLCKQFQDDLYLTVDKDNMPALALYEKLDFRKIQEYPSYFMYKKDAPLLLPVSLGEAVDKITILDIKMEKIQDKIKKQYCKYEYDALYSKVKGFIESQPFLYKSLKYINAKIWDYQDTVRGSGTDDKATLLTILDLNDMRFRIKNKINLYSNLKEQKGYKKEIGLFVGHLGMGDMINTNGAIRYLSLQVDYLYVVCKKCYLENIKEMLNDEPFIEVIGCEDEETEIESLLTAKEYNKNTFTKMFLAGHWGNQTDFKDLPNSFYRHLNLPVELRHTFFNYVRREQLPVPARPYRFTHCGSSNMHKLNIAMWDTNTIFTIDPNRNYYEKGHEWFEEAELYINKNILQYCDSIENADVVHVTDSSFYCLACYLPLKAKRKACYCRMGGMKSLEYNFE